MVIVHTIVNNEVIMTTDDYKYVSSNNYTIHINKILAAGGEIYSMIILIYNPTSVEKTLYKSHLYIEIDKCRKLLHEMKAEEKSFLRLTQHN